MTATTAAAPASRSENALLSAPILPTLLRLTLPNLAAMLVVALVAICETAYVGILGTTPLAAIALVFPMIMLMQMLSAGAMGGGVSSAISRALGAGDLDRAEALAFHAIVIGVAAGASFSVIFLAFGDSIFRTLGGSGGVLGQALVYANIALTGAVLAWLLNTFASIVRGTGNMRVPSLTLLSASGLQIVLGGSAGARASGRFRASGWPVSPRAWSSPQAVAALFLWWFLRSGRGRLKLRFARALQREMFFDILKVGAVSAIGPLQVVLTVLILTRLVASFGAEALAGYGIGARLEFLLVPIAFARRRRHRADGGHGHRRRRRRACAASGVDRQRPGCRTLGIIGAWSAICARTVVRRCSPAIPAVLRRSQSHLRLAGPGVRLLRLRALASTSPRRAPAGCSAPVLAGDACAWS